MQTAYRGIFENGLVTLDEQVPWTGSQRVLVIFPEDVGGVCLVSPRPQQASPPRVTGSAEDRLAEVRRSFSEFQIDTRGWKFDREEANER